MSPGMADESEVAKTEAKAAVPVMSLMLSVVAAVVVATGVLGGAGWYMVKSGRLPIVQGATRVEIVHGEPAKMKLVALDPLLVNLADSGGRSYLRVAMTLRVEEQSPVKGEKPKEPEKGKPVNENEAAMRDAALEVLGRRTGVELLAADGKEQLKADLRTAMQKHVPEVKVVDVLFTEFLVQQ